MEMDAGHAGHLLLQVVNVNLLTLIEPLFGAADSRHMNRRRIAAFERNFAAVYLGPASAKTSRESPVFCDDRKLPGLFCRCAPSAVVKISQRKGIVNGFLSGIVLLAQEKSAVTVRSVAEIFPGFRIRGINLPVAVGKFQNDFGQKGLFITKIIIIFYHKCLGIAPPAGAKSYADSIVSGF